MSREIALRMLTAARGARGELDAFLEVTDEAELRGAILSIDSCDWGWYPMGALPDGIGSVLVSHGEWVGEARLTERGWYRANEDWSDSHAEPIEPDAWRPLPRPLFPGNVCETGAA